MVSIESVYVLIAVVALILWGISKYILYLGLLPSHSGGVLAPWGSVVSARKVKGPKPTEIGALLGRALLAAGVCMVVLPAVGLVFWFASGSIPLESSSYGSDYQVLGLLVAAFVCRQERGFLRAAVFGFIGCLTVGVFAGTLMSFVFMQVFEPAFLSGNPFFLLGNMTFCALGTAFGITFAPVIVRFERTFADGHTDQIAVSSRTKAYDQLSALTAS